jgi:carbonic anhydrase
MSRSALRADPRLLLAALLLAGSALALAAAPANDAAVAAPAARPPAAAPVTAPTTLQLPDLRQRIEEKIARQRAARAEALQLRVPATPPAADAAAPKPAVRATAPIAKAAKVVPAAPQPAQRPAAPAAASAHAATHSAWSYDGEAGPAHWGEMHPSFSTCAHGQRQSPIDIREGIAVELEAIRFDYQASAFRVVDNGHTVQVNVAPGSHLAVGGRRYELQQFHFHRPSEERINGRQFDLVAHLVHRSDDGRLAVVAVLMDAGKAHPLVQLVWNNLPLEKHEEQAAPVPMDLNALLPEDRRYYTYMGSLTTPPCSEGVLWLVMKQPSALSPEQLAIFTRLYPMNARPLQAASGRLIKESE